MKANEKLKAFRAKSETELKAEKIDLLKAQFNLRMQKGTVHTVHVQFHTAGSAQFVYKNFTNCFTN